MLSMQIPTRLCVVDTFFVGVFFLRVLYRVDIS